MKIKVIVTGKHNASFVTDAVAHYSKRIKHYIGFEFIVLPDVKNGGKLPVDKLKEQEGIQLLAQIQQDDALVLLDEHGKFYTSLEFAGFIEQQALRSVKNLVFAVGGAYGFSDAIKQKARYILSVSTMTFSHQIIRILFMEQLYRAFTIIKGEPYHNE